MPGIWGMIKEIKSTNKTTVANAKWKQNNAIYKHSQLRVYCNKHHISRRASFKFGFIALIWTSFHLQVFILLLSAHAWLRISGILPSVENIHANHHWSWSCPIHKFIYIYISRMQIRQAGSNIAFIWNYCFTYFRLYFAYRRLISVW